MYVDTLLKSETNLVKFLIKLVG